MDSKIWPASGLAKEPGDWSGARVGSIKGVQGPSRQMGVGRPMLSEAINSGFNRS